MMTSGSLKFYHLICGITQMGVAQYHFRKYVMKLMHNICSPMSFMYTQCMLSNGICHDIQAGCQQRWRRCNLWSKRWPNAQHSRCIGTQLTMCLDTSANHMVTNEVTVQISSKTTDLLLIQ